MADNISVDYHMADDTTVTAHDYDTYVALRIGAEHEYTSVTLYISDLNQADELLFAAQQARDTIAQQGGNK